MLRRIVIAGLTAALVAPAFVIFPASAAVLFSCNSATGSATLSPGLVHDKRPQSLSIGPTAPAGPADLALATTSDAGVKANGASVEASLSADGTKVAFRSVATNLDPGDTDSRRDIYVKDLTTGDIVLASTSDAGVKGNDDSFLPSLSDDGTRVAFSSDATNLDPGSGSSFQQVYVKDLTTGNIILASTSDTGIVGVAESRRPKLSGDGTKVAFQSSAPNLDPADTDYQSDVYVKDLTTGDITLASTSDAGVKGNAFSGGVPGLAEDGSRVAFLSEANNLDPADTEPTFDSYFRTDDVYVKDLTTGDITLASSNDAGVDGNGYSDFPSLSGDGARVAFVSAATNLEPGDTGGTGSAGDASEYDIYMKDLSTGDITLASRSDSGTSDTGAMANNYDHAPSVSADGTRFAFGSFSTNLDAADTSTDDDSYVKDLTTGDTTLATTTDTGVKGAGSPTSLSADGTRVAFTSGLQMDPADTDALVDVYVKQLPATPTSLAIADCSNGQSATARIVDIRSNAPRPLGCPVALGGALGNDYPDQTAVLVGQNPSLRVDWASGPDSYGLAKLKMGTTGTQWRAVLVIQASTGHDTPATNQYLPASGSGFTKTKLKGRLDWSALDSFNCSSGTADPISWLDLVNNGSWIVKNA
jgi:hypothetical protein